MQFATVQNHMRNCEITIEQIFMAKANAKDKKLSPDEFNKISTLFDSTLEMIVDVYDDKSFKIPPELPFTKQDVLEQLRYYHTKFEAILPKPERPHP
jgi:hypothetical protein